MIDDKSINNLICLIQNVLSQDPVLLFPKEERSNLIKRIENNKPIITIRINKEYGKYKLGQTYHTNLGYDLKVVKEQYIDDIKKYQYYNQIKNNKKWIKLFDKYGNNKFHVLYLQAVQYNPPMSKQQIVKNNKQHLLNDPIHKWRAQTGIQLIHKQPTLKQLNRIMKNWNLMSDQMKQKSDIKSIQLFGMTNVEHYNKLKVEYK